MKKYQIKWMLSFFIGLITVFLLFSPVSATVTTGTEGFSDYWLVHDANAMGATGDASGAEGGVTNALESVDTDYIWVREAYPFRGNIYLFAAGLQDPGLPISSFGVTKDLHEVKVYVNYMLETNIGVLDNTGNFYIKIYTHDDIDSGWLLVHNGYYGQVSRVTGLITVNIVEDSNIWNAIEDGDYIVKAELRLYTHEEWGTRTYLNIDDFQAKYWTMNRPQS